MARMIFVNLPVKDDRDSRRFQDPDGHLRDFVWMDPSAIEG